MTKHSPDPKANELLALSEEVSRVAHSLAQLALEPGTPRPARRRSGRHASQDAVARLIRARRARGSYVPPDLFGEPVWDMLLYLLHEEMSHSRVSASAAVEASGVPVRIGRRWLNALAERRLVLISADAPGDPVVRLSPDLSGALRRYVDEVVGS